MVNDLTLRESQRYCCRLTLRYPGVSGVKVLKDGHHVSRASDFIIYSVEAEFIQRVVAEYGPCLSSCAESFASINNPKLQRPKSVP